MTDEQLQTVKSYYHIQVNDLLGFIWDAQKQPPVFERTFILDEENNPKHPTVCLGAEDTEAYNLKTPEGRKAWKAQAPEGSRVTVDDGITFAMVLAHWLEGLVIDSTELYLATTSQA